MKKILLIEDDTTLRENTAELLQMSGYEMFTASNGKKGIELAKEYYPDLIICDIMMPELDGYGVLEKLSESKITNKIPFIFLSAKSEKKEIRKGMELGADDYLTKPFEEEELINAIESRLAKVEILKEKGSSSEKEKNTILTINELKNFFFDEGEYLTFKEGEAIYKQGNHPNYVYLIERGMVKTHKIDEYGKELITKICKEDEFFGHASFTQNFSYKEDATALKDTSVYVIGKDFLRSVLEQNRHLTMELIDYLTEGLSDLKEQLLQMAYGSVRKKTATTILQFVDKLKKTSDNEGIKICRTDLASVAGIAPESFIRTMADFKKEGFIAIEGRSIKILDIKSLEKIS